MEPSVPLDKPPLVQVHLPDGSSEHILLDQAAADFVKYLDYPGDRDRAILNSLIGAFHLCLSRRGLAEVEIKEYLQTYCT